MKTTQTIMNPDKGKTGNHPEQGKVSITINGAKFETRPGQHSGANIKSIGGVPAEYELEQVVDGRFQPIADGDKVQLRGDEIFVGHPKNSSSA